jgi:oligopeptide transport system substrate-binding protein
VSLRSPDLWEVGPSESDIPILERIGRGRMAGREAELRMARGLWAKVQAGRSEFLVISGEAGIGKTRLVRELITQARVSRGVVLQAWNDNQPTQPFAAFRQILRAALDELPDPVGQCPQFVVAELLSLVPEYQHRFPGVEPRESIESAADQQRLFESLAVCLSLLSETTPLLVVIEDGQWADSGTLSMLRYLVQQTRERSILYVLTHRAVDVPEAPALHAVLHDFQREGVTVSVTLDRLNAAETLTMLQSLLGEAVSTELVNEIFRTTEGNPFFIEEVCKGLAEAGRLTQHQGEWRLGDRSRITIPASIRLAIQERLKALPTEAQQVLEIAAVCGPVFDRQIVGQLSGLQRAAADDWLDAAERAELVRPLPNGEEPRYAFAHSLIPATMIEAMAPSRRMALHGQVAEAVEVARPQEFESLAFHYRQAGEGGKAAHYLVQAGDRAQTFHACPEAIESFSSAIEFQRSAGQLADAARTLLKLGLAYSADFQFDKALRAYEQAFELWDEVREAEPPMAALEPREALRFAVSEPLSLDPGRAGDDISVFVLGQLMEGLVDLDEAWGIVPSLAASWLVSPDGRQYTFHLRPGWQWSDGNPVTAHDFEYAWKRNLRMVERECPAGLLLYLLEGGREFAAGSAPPESVGVRARDNRTLEVRLNRPASFFPQLLTHPVTYPLPQWAVEGPHQPWTDVGHFVSNGPFRLESWAPGKQIVLSRNKRYRGLWSGNIDRIEAPVVHEPEDLLDAFDAGALDGISLLQASPATIAVLRSRYRRELHTMRTLSTVYLAFNCRRPPFDSASIRQAFIHAMDRQGLLSRIDIRQPAPGGFLPPGMPGHSPALGLPYDPERGRRLLADAGYPKGAGFPQLELLYTGGPGGNPVAAFQAEAWERNLGVQIQPVGVPWDEFMHRRESDPPALSVSGWSADYPDPDNMLRVLFHSQEGVNAIGWRQPEFDRLTERAAATVDRKQRLELYREADRILVNEESAVVPLWYGEARQLLQPYVRVPRTPPSMLHFKQVKVDRVQYR